MGRGRGQQPRAQSRRAAWRRWRQARWGMAASEGAKTGWLRGGSRAWRRFALEAMRWIAGIEAASEAMGTFTSVQRWG
ncbi:hypothetical protein E2562_023600 [Oryza meyeriana var. granulata]|uniref:Uncharacterized protein n=1 Tax=Oryza meyeriana var. granulata TaxID=110450 RepID=A0A6G1FBC4_9ORYZ|nr:hypothetical protein E2562_023600 [Oryza meyeriana var. granulata]